MKTINVVSYHRVSTDIQDFTRQILDIETYCKAHNYTIVKSFGEKESGTKKERPELKNLLNYIKYNSVEYIIISELSRLARSNQVLNLIEQFHDLGIGLICLKENLITLNEDKTVNATSNLILTILSGVNVAELATLKYRIKSGIKNGKINGNVHGSKNFPYGFMKDVDSKKLVINANEAIIIKEIFDLSLNGKGTKIIANYLNNKEYPTRTNKKWRDATVYSILTNTIFKGERKINYITKRNPNANPEILPIEAIIDTVTFDNVQINLSSKGNMKGINRKYDYLFNDRLITCGICGKSYFAHKRANGNDNVYKCISSRYSAERCSNKGVNIDKLEKAVTEYIIKYNDRYIANKINNTDEIELNLKKLKIESKEISSFLKRQDNIEDNYLDLFAESKISKEKLNIKIEIIKNEKRKLHNQLLNINSNIATIEKQLIQYKNKDKIKQQIESGNFDKKNIINSLISKITIYPADKHLTTITNDITVIVIVETLGEKCKIYISNRTNETERWLSNEVPNENLTKDFNDNIDYYEGYYMTDEEFYNRINIADIEDIKAN